VNYITIGIGVLMVMFAVYVMYLRFNNDNAKLGKLVKMKEMWGEKKGSVFHYIGYVLVPILLGIVFIALGFMGTSIF